MCCRIAGESVEGIEGRLYHPIVLKAVGLRPYGMTFTCKEMRPRYPVEGKQENKKENIVKACDTG